MTYNFIHGAEENKIRRYEEITNNNTENARADRLRKIAVIQRRGIGISRNGRLVNDGINGIRCNSRPNGGGGNIEDLSGKLG